jgi:hypothetical protein
MLASQHIGEAMTWSMARRVWELKYRLALAAMPAGYGRSEAPPTTPDIVSP